MDDVINAHYRKDTRFVKFGDFNRSMLLWYNKTVGYFVTRPDGRGMNGDHRLSPSFVEKHVAAK